MPGFIPPMKATAAELPAGDGTWATEIKWDGMRLQYHARQAPNRSPAAVAYSARGHEVTTSFPELEGLAEDIGLPAVLDGEVVVLSEGRPSFAHLQQRIHRTMPGPELIAAAPVFYFVFDLLELDGRSLIDVAYRDRRRLLEQVIEDGSAWRLPASATTDPKSLFDLSAERGLEGIVCKRLDSPYRPGTRSVDWIKVKHRFRQEFVVAGWLRSKAAGSDATRPRADVSEAEDYTRLASRELGSLILAVNDDTGRLVFCGSVGSGIGDLDRQRIGRLLSPGPAPVDIGSASLSGAPHWVEPTIVVEVEYSLWPVGGTLWHPVFRGIRIDRRPADVQRE